MKQKMMILQLGAVILAFAMIVSLVNGLNVQTAGSFGNPSLSKTSISVKEGITGKITVKNKPTGAKVFWSSKNKKIAEIILALLSMETKCGLQRERTFTSFLLWMRWAFTAR